MPRVDINVRYPPPLTSLGNDATKYAAEIHARATKPKNYRQIISRAVDAHWQLDLATMWGFRDNWYGRPSENDNYVYVLVIIDVFSRYMWLIPLKEKTAEATRQGFIKTLPRQPLVVTCDEGKEFEGSFKTYLRQRGIQTWRIYGKHKASIAERAIRTFQTYLWKLLEARQTRRWIDLLPLVAEYYNNQPHSALNGLTPTQACDPANYDMLWDHQFGLVKPDIPVPPRFRVDDRVRVSVQRSAFEKGYYGNWSREIYRVRTVSRGHPVMYQLENPDGSVIVGKFYEEELLKSAVPDAKIEVAKTERIVPKDYTQIEKVIDAVTTWKGRAWKYKGKPMVWLKCKFVGLTDAANEALPRDKLWLPYVTFDFDSEGRPHPAIEALLKRKKLWTVAQDVKKNF